MLKGFKGVTNFYGNNTVYMTDGEQHVQRFDKMNYDITSLKNIGDELWMTSGIIVALGATCSPREAIDELRAILLQLEADAKNDNGLDDSLLIWKPSRASRRKTRKAVTAQRKS